MQPATQQQDQQSDGQIASVLIDCFDRDAFKIPFHLEVSMPDFLSALEETSAAIKTGQRALYGGGTEKIRPVSAIRDRKTKQSFTQVANLVDELKHTFSRFKKSGDIYELGKSMEFTQYHVSPEAGAEIDRIKTRIFEVLKKIEVFYKLNPTKKGPATPIEAPDHFKVSITYPKRKLKKFESELKRKNLLNGRSSDEAVLEVFITDEAVASRNKRPLDWTGSLPELQCLLSTMKKENIIANGKLVWLTAAKVFTHNGEKIGPERLRKQHLIKTRDAQKIKAIQKLINEAFELKQDAAIESAIS